MDANGPTLLLTAADQPLTTVKLLTPVNPLTSPSLPPLVPAACNRPHPTPAVPGARRRTHSEPLSPVFWLAWVSLGEVSLG